MKKYIPITPENPLIENMQNHAAMADEYWIDQDDNITLTNPVAISAAMEAFIPSRDGASPTNRLLHGEFDQKNLQEWIEEGTIHGKQAVVFYLFDNSEAEHPENMSFDAEHVCRIEISI